MVSTVRRPGRGQTHSPAARVHFSVGVLLELFQLVEGPSRRIGQALHNAYEGEFDFHYDEEGYFIRVNWTRET